jgi:hypothetical protein
MRVLSILILGLVLMACGQTAKPAAKAPPVTMNGSGIENTAPFHLDSGNYLVQWTATPRSQGASCYHGGTLKTTTGKSIESIANASLNRGEPQTTGETRVYNVASGEYFVHMSSGCNWTVTLTQQG